MRQQDRTRRPVLGHCKRISNGKTQRYVKTGRIQQYLATYAAIGGSKPEPIVAKTF
jgi:DNA polymerase II large subunit